MNKESQILNIAGLKFNRLQALRPVGKYKNGSIIWLCVCECGTETEVLGQKLRNGHTKSCGCLAKELTAERFKTHGASYTRLFKIWSGMRNRCSNPKNVGWPNYGGRGISVTPEWDTFEAFSSWALSNGYSETLTLDRKDNNGNYCPENCQWATHAEQNRNKRNNVRLSDGSLAHENSEVSPAQFRARILKGMSVDEAATTPNMRPRHYMEDGRLAVEVAEENGIPAATFHARVRNYGWSVEKAATVKVRR